MPRTKSTHSKQVNSNYQSLYLWASFLLGMISLGIVLWNRRETSFTPVMPAGNRHPVHKDVEVLHSCNLNRCIHAGSRQDSSFASSLALSALTYYQTQNSFLSTLTLMWPTLISATQFDKRQVGGNEFRVNTYIAGQQIGTAIKKLGNSEFIITWNSDGQDGSSWGVYAQRYANNGTPLGKEFQVNSFTQDEQSQAYVEVLNASSFIIVWHSNLQDGSFLGIYARIYSNNGTALTNEFRVNTFTYGNQGYPSVFSNNHEQFMVLWQSNSHPMDYAVWRIYGRYYFNNGMAITDEIKLTDYMNTVEGQGAGVGVALSNNNWAVTWHSDKQDGSSFGIYAKTFSNHTTTISSEFRINQFTPNSQAFPVIIHFNSEYIVIFVSQGSEFVADYSVNNSVYGRRFADNGTALSDDFRISFDKLSEAHRVSADVLTNDYFIVAWNAYSNMAGKFNMYGRICHREGNCTNPQFRITSSSDYASIAWNGRGIAALTNKSFIITYNIMGADPDGSAGVYAKIINLSDLNITLPTQTVTTTERTTSVVLASKSSSPKTAQETLITTESITAIEPTKTTQEILISTESTTIDSTKSLGSETPANTDNVGILAGGIAGACAAGALIMVAGFFAVNKCRKSKPNAESNNDEVALQNKITSTQQSSRNYGEIDATKQNSHQYDRPVELKI